MDRIPHDEYFATLAYVASARSTCTRAKVGAILVKNGLVKSTGYNGSARGLPHCSDVGCILDDEGHCIASVHAEANAICQAGENVEGADIYSTHLPCIECAKLIINTRIKNVFYIYPYMDNRSKLYMSQEELLKRGNVKVTRLHMIEFWALYKGDIDSFIKSHEGHQQVSGEHVK